MKKSLTLWNFFCNFKGAEGGMEPQATKLQEYLLYFSKNFKIY